MVERLSSPQQNQLGMKSNASIELDGATMSRAWRRTADAGNASDNVLMRAVSFFGPDWAETRATASATAEASGRGWFSSAPKGACRVPAGFGTRRNEGGGVGSGGDTGDRNGIMGVWARGSVLTGATGGDRRGERVRDGKTAPDPSRSSISF